MPDSMFPSGISGPSAAVDFVSWWSGILRGGVREGSCTAGTAVAAADTLRSVEIVVLVGFVAAE